MACAKKKVYSYGAAKKNEKESAPWTGMLKGDNFDLASGKQENTRPKIPLKKGVWSKATGKSFIHPSPHKKFDELDDAFGFEHDPFGFEKEEDPFSSKCKNTSPLKKDKKNPQPFSNQIDRPKLKYPTIIQPKSRISGKLILPQDSVTITSEELKLFGSPRKEDVKKDVAVATEKVVKKNINDKRKQLHFKPSGDVKEKLKIIKNIHCEKNKKVPNSSNNNNRGEIIIESGLISLNVKTVEEIETDLLKHAKKDYKDAIVCTKTLSVQLVDIKLSQDSPIKTKEEEPSYEEDFLTASDLSDSDTDDSSSNSDTTMVKTKVKSKKSLFSCYDKMNKGEQNSLLQNGDLTEFEFLSNDDDLDDLIEQDSPMTASQRFYSNPAKRTMSSDEPHSCPIPKKSKSEDVMLSDDTVDQAEETEHIDQTEDVPTKPKAAKSPFKSKKPSMGLSRGKIYKRYSSLPTDITQADEEIEKNIGTEEEELISPPPMYKKNIFGFEIPRNSGTKVRVRRDEKELYTVVKNTKHAYECLEHGESQQFKDDLEYLLDGLKSTHTVSTRCLSALELASKCISSVFRMHIKAHGIIEHIFNLLEDALSDENLLLCVSIIIYVLAKDKLKINFNKKTIGFMLQIISKKRDDNSDHKTYEKLIKKVRTLLEKQDDVDIDLESIDATVLTREALLSLTVQRTGEWFKDEIRLLGGLDDVADIVYACSKCIQKKISIDQNCKQMKRCLAMFGDMTFKSTVNQAYVISCKNSIVIDSCIRTLHNITNFDVEIELTAAAIDCLAAILRLLMNLSHENKNGCLKICKQQYGLNSILRVVLYLSQYLPEDLKFEISVVSLGLLVNLVENSPQNKTILNRTYTPVYFAIKSPDESEMDETLLSPVEAFMQMFILHSEACKETDLMQELEKLENEEEEEDAGRLYQDDEYALTCGDIFEDTVEGENVEKPVDDSEINKSLEVTKTKPAKKSVGTLNEKEKHDIQNAVDKAQQHMENSYLAAYTALLIGLLVEENVENQKLIHSLLPNRDFSMLLESITKIVSFMKMTNTLSKHGFKCMERIIEVIKNCKEHFAAEEEQLQKN